MLPNGMEPPLKMLTTKQKIRATERMLNHFSTLSECSSDHVPGNYLAKQRRRKHDNSKMVFPEKKSKNKKEWKTNYTMNFKFQPKCRPSSPRPCSPTRRNNPHPSQKFLTWKIPTRVFDYGPSKDANVAFLTSNIGDTFLSFYDDYSGKKDRLNEVNTELLLELTKSYTTPCMEAQRLRQKRATVELRENPGVNQGLTLPSLLRKSWSPDKSSIAKGEGSKKSRLSPLFMKPEFRPLFQTWYDKASSKIKEKAETTVAHLEENYIQKALESALKPDAIELIEDWLLTADEEEREIAMQFIQTILLHSFENQKLLATDSEVADEMERRQQKSVSTPPPPSPVLSEKTASSNPRSSHHHHHHMKKACQVCARKGLESALQHLQTLASSPEAEVPDITELLNPLHPGVIAQKEARKRFVFGRRKLIRPKQANNALSKGNKGSLFVYSKKPKGRNFTIHPEW